MRDYLYIWHNSEEQFFLASGIEFRDLSGVLGSVGGLVLLKHQAEDAEFDRESRFDFLPAASIPNLMSENLYQWGDFCWADFSSNTFPNLARQEIAELLYFSHRAEKFQNSSIESLGNKFLAYIHDDGWYCKIYYSKREHASALLTSISILKAHPQALNDLENESCAFWVYQGIAQGVEPTSDIDTVLNERLP